MQCVLCFSSLISSLHTEEDRKLYHHCLECDLRFLDPRFRLSLEEEKERYELHNNDVSDIRYQKFVDPLYKEIIKRIPTSQVGLDFGCGTGPVLTSLLQKSGYNILKYDPIFHIDKTALNRTYGFIFAVEVVEHFFNPHLEFERLTQMLQKPGFLGIMTDVYHEKINFHQWYYRRDPTHVTFYSEKTFEWIQQRYDIPNLEIIGNRVCIFSN